MILFHFLWLLPSHGDDDWTLHSIAPGPEAEGMPGQDDDVLGLAAPDEEGANGYWMKSFEVEGGSWVEFSAKRKTTRIPHPRRSCVVRIEWYGADGRPVTSREKVNPTYFGSESTIARPDFPRDKEVDLEGWTTVSDRYPVPADAVKAVVQLHLRWAPGGEVLWKAPSLLAAEPLPERKVTLAAVHTQLSGEDRTIEENREHLRTLIEKAAAQGADLVVLPELMNCKGITHDYVSAAEKIPGGTTQFFGALARELDLYVVVGMAERLEGQVFNCAVLLGPDASIVGIYRKVTLPREEIARGISPADAYPVFKTRFGKVGMMICYDVFFPEVARELAMRGAEIIAVPIWGGNPALASARCIENGVHLVTSTYTDHDTNWMKTAIWDREGRKVATATAWDTVVTATVDLNQRTYWHGLGDFQARIAREAPVRKMEPVFHRREGSETP